MSKVYALLIAINDYPIVHHRLGGCVNDMLLIKQYLENHFPDQLKLKILQNDEATRQATIDNFGHFDKAENGDVCLLYYSGHGSQVKAPKEFWTESDGMNESIVLYDSRLPGGRDLMDKELSYLIWKANEGKAIHFVVIMDCCHSGHSTRGANDLGILVRMAEPSFTPTNVTDYIGYTSYLKTEHADGRLEIAPPQGRHILLAAAKSYQTAKEKSIDGDQHGIFTYSLISALLEQGGWVSYAELIQQTVIQAGQLVSDQAPQFESTQDGDDRKVFLMGSETLANSWLISYDKGNWWLNAGTVHGIRPGGMLHLFETGTSIMLGNVSVARSAIISEMPRYNTDKQYRVRYQPPVIEQVNIAIAPDSDPEADPSLQELSRQSEHLFTLTKQVTNARFLIQARQHQLYLALPATDAPLFLPVDGYDSTAVEDLGQKIDSVLRWHNLLAANNSRTRLVNSDIIVEVQRVTQYGNPDDASPAESLINPTAPIICSYRYENGEWYQPHFRLKITNNSQEKLYVSALYLSQNYEISNSFFPKEELAPSKSAWMTYENSRTLPLYIWPDEEQFKELGINEITEYVKILISTEDFSTYQYNQKGIDLFRFKRQAERGVGSIASIRPKLPDWIARTVTLKIICPPDTAKVSPTGSPQLHGIVVKPHPTLKASVTLTSMQDATRSLGDNSCVDEAFRRFFDDEPTRAFSFADNNLTGTRGMGTSPNLNVVELVDVVGADSVTPESPLQLDISAYLKNQEILLPFGYDVETGLFYPVGVEREGIVEIEQLPDPMAVGERSLGGSVKLFFKKLFSANQQTGVLSLVTVDEQEIVMRIREDDANGLNVIADTVAGASRILLFIHGIIGDTDDMVKAVRRIKLADSGLPILSHYDAILAFDYENLDTTLQETAQRLQDRLKAVNVTPNDDKVVHIIAHSMGGLVSRWLIEKLQGSHYIDHLIMLGTPNNGSPWSDVEAMAAPLITKAINGVTLLKPYLIPLAFLSKQGDRMFTTLRQMQKGSEFLKSLNDGVESSVPYTIIAGNTQLVPVVFEKDMTLWRKMWARFKTRSAYTFLDTFLFHDANDIAVLVSSIQEVSGLHVVKQVPIACNHISYFCDDDSLKAIGESIAVIK